MKIAILADRLVMGGLETHIITVTNELLRRGHRVLLNAAAVNPEILEQFDHSSGRFELVLWSGLPVEDLRAFDPDLIHAHPFTAIFRGYESARLLKKAFFVTMHGLYDFGLDRSPLGNLVCARVKRVIAVDHRVAELLAGSIAAPQKITVIYNGLDLRRFLPRALRRTDRSLWGLQPEWATLVVISRMADGKEQTVFQLVEAIPQLAARMAGVNLLIVGAGCRFSELQERIAALRLGAGYKIAALGEQTDVTRYLALADLVLACDRAAMEAMACRKPVLAMNAAGFAAPLDAANYQTILLGRRGYQPRSQPELIQMLAAILTDTNRLEQLARDGYLFVTRYFDIVKQVDQLEELYRLP
jgi:glycosyltransferase involved in cell wall biosynthesis